MRISVGKNHINTWLEVVEKVNEILEDCLGQRILENTIPGSQDPTFAIGSLKRKKPHIMTTSSIPVKTAAIIKQRTGYGRICC